MSSYFFGLMPIFWLPMHHMLLPSQFVANFLANQGRWNWAPKYWRANFGGAAVGVIQTAP
jgi:hypothetical protein